MGDSYRVLPRPDKIKANWTAGNVGRYPDTVTVEMSDGARVTYRIDIQQPNPHLERMNINLERMDSIIQGYPVGRHEKRP